jgi:hypothetical protein
MLTTITPLNKTQIFIEKAIKIHGNKYDYSKVKYINTSTNVIIICDDHDEFLQSPEKHLIGQGCKKCGRKIAGEKTRKTNDSFIQRALEIHGTKYDYSHVEYVETYTPVIIICVDHGQFSQKPRNHLRGKGCEKCGKESASNKLRSTTDEFIQKATLIHGTRYDYTKVEYINLETPIIIICSKHGQFPQTPCTHLAKSGCTKCAREECVIKFRSNTNDFIQRAKAIHGDTYDYSKVEYVDLRTKIVILCKIHGKFLQSPDNHLAGSKCTKCQSCPSCLLWKTNGKLCKYCKPQNKTNKPYQKTKEMEVVKFLKDNLPDNEFIHNKSVGNDCTGTHLFPDILFNCIGYNLIVEVDEFKHRGASYECDERRMYDIIAKLGMPCIFIRYNPDAKGKSDKNVLLDKVKKYLDLNFNEPIWDKYGFKAKYLFY